MSPQVGWFDESNNVVSFDDALASAEAYGEFGGMPPEVLLGMRENLTKERPDAISVTQLLGCARKVFLERTVDFAATPESNYPAFRGQIIHGILEKMGGSATVEKRVEREYRGITISGQPDNLRTIRAPGGSADRQLIRDWKSTHEVPKYENAYTHHQQQANIYRWLLGLDWRLTDLEIVYVSLREVKIVPLKRGGSNRYGRAIPNQVWTDEETEAFLDQRLMILSAQRKHNAPIRYDAVSVDDLWQCAYCPVRNECYRLAADESKAAWEAGDTVTRMPPREAVKKGKKK